MSFIQEPEKYCLDLIVLQRKSSKLFFGVLILISIFATLTYVQTLEQLQARTEASQAQIEATEACQQSINNPECNLENLDNQTEKRPLKMFTVDFSDGSEVQVEAPEDASDAYIMRLAMRMKYPALSRRDEDMAVRLRKELIESLNSSYLNSLKDATPQVQKRSRSYPIEYSFNDELFIINGEKFKARTYCFGMYEGDEVIFIEGSELGVCVSAELLNKRSGDECSVWCD